MLDSTQDRCVNPGHSIETSWFVMHEGIYREDSRMTDTAIRMMNDSLEIGWDKVYVGLLPFVDVDGKPAEQLEWDMKMWRPHTEAIYAALLAHFITVEDR